MGEGLLLAVLATLGGLLVALIALSVVMRR